MMKLKNFLLIGSFLSCIGGSFAAPIDILTNIEIGRAQAVFDEGGTAIGWFPSLNVGLQKQITNKVYLSANGGIELAAFAPGRNEIGGNMFRGKLGVATSYRLPITILRKTRFFASVFADFAYGSYGTLYDTRWDYVWQTYDDLNRYEISGGAKLSAEYRPSIDFGATFGGSCDLSLNNLFDGCRAGIGFRF